MTAGLVHLADTVRDLCVAAGSAILEIYMDPAAYGAIAKGDGSPLTRADLASHQLLKHGLQVLAPEVPMISEESGDVPQAVCADWTRYWLVDPLDGTKEFLARNGEFTVNVALIEVQEGIGRPVLGVVHVPTSGISYLGIAGQGAWREDAGGRTVITPARPRDAVQIVASRSHGNAATDAFIAGLEALFGSIKLTTSGSSLKLCRVAEGSAHYYPRVAPTMEWDTAAAQAIVEAAGGHVWRYGTREPVVYGKPDLLNPPFIVVHADDAALPDAYRPLEVP